MSFSLAAAGKLREAKRNEVEPETALLSELVKVQQQLRTKAAKKYLAKERKKQRLLNMKAQLQELKDNSAQLKHQLCKKYAADLDSAKARTAQAQEQQQEVDNLKLQNAKKAAMVRETNAAIKQIEIASLPKMIQAPDWVGSSNWQPYQRVEQLLYTIKDGKLVKYAESTALQLRISQQHCAAGGFLYVFYAQMQKSGAQYVVKRMYSEGAQLEDDIRLAEADIRDHLVAAKCAKEFQAEANSAGVATSKMHFTEAVSLVIADKTDAAYPAPSYGKVVYFMEAYVSGQDICKWSLNW